MTTIHDIRTKILLSKRENINYHTEHCLQKMWYILLTYNDESWKNEWHKYISFDCNKSINKYFKNRNIYLE